MSTISIWPFLLSSSSSFLLNDINSNGKQNLAILYCGAIKFLFVDWYCNAISVANLRWGISSSLISRMSQPNQLQQQHIHTNNSSHSSSDANIRVSEVYWSLVDKADKKFSKIRDLPYYERHRSLSQAFYNWFNGLEEFNCRYYSNLIEF